ncbi:hypothetical protein MMC25_001508 [Agyrium rufum]|nr:hypothetical protein [Agyrium rufum]
MTVIIVSLFLPYTVYFDLPKRTSPQRPVLVRNASKIRLGEYSEDAISLFTTGQMTPRGARTPAIATENEEFFLSNRSVHDDVHQVTKDKSTVPISDPHSPTWGRRTLTQPKSRAGGLPSSSISRLLQTATRNHDHSILMRQAAALDEKRDRSHERALKEAAWTIHPAEQGNGGLRNAINGATEAGILKDKILVGTLGMPIDALDEKQRTEIAEKLANEYDALMVPVADSDFDGHYSHYCKRILSPVFHYQIPDNPKSKAYEDHSWIYYKRTNQAFADRIVKDWKRGDIIWIHDYHLLLVPEMVRKVLPEAQIGFFLHVAFPSSEVFRCLGVRTELLKGMLGANLIGFQTDEYCRHFLQTANRILCVETTPDGLQLEDRFVNVATFPIGIDPGILSRKREDPEVQEWIERIQTKYEGKQLIVARDKLDHIRGVRQKLLAYELFLNQYPEMREKVVLIQVATSTNEEAELDATVSHIVTRINSLHSTLEHQPLVYLKQDIESPQYLAMLSVAHVLINTSLREGMNLSSREFLFCQDGRYTKKKHGSLILSEFTGSTSFFQGSELSVNPWDYRQCAEAIRKSLQMSDSEREQRWTKLMEVTKYHTAERWVSTFLDHLAKKWKDHARRDTISIPRLNVNELVEQYKSSSRRLLMLDYEGTMAAFGGQDSIIFNLPDRTRQVIEDLIADERNIVYVMSGRRPDELDRLFYTIPRVGLIAENGCFYKEFGTENWIEAVDMKKTVEWKDSALSVLNYYRDRIEGSWVEERYCSVILHTDKAVDQVGASRQAGECANHINDSLEEQRVHAVPVDGGLCVEALDWDKGTAATNIFSSIRRRKEKIGAPIPEFLLVIGDSREDEAIYRWANRMEEEKTIKNVSTVTVSSRNTEAGATLGQGVSGVLSALQKLSASS